MAPDAADFKPAFEASWKAKPGRQLRPAGDQSALGLRPHPAGMLDFVAANT